MGIMKSFVESFILPGALLPLMAVSCENTGYQERPEFPGSGLDSSAFVRMNIDLEYVKHVKSLVQEADGSYTIVLPDGGHISLAVFVRDAACSMQECEELIAAIAEAAACHARGVSGHEAVQ